MCSWSPQVALSLLLLIIAGLFARSVARAAHVDAGFETERTAMIALNLGSSGYSEAQARGFHRRLSERVTGYDGVRYVVPTDRVRLDIYGSQAADLLIATPDRGTIEDVVQVAHIAPEYFAALGTG